MVPLLRIKQGATFMLTGQYLEDDGITPKSLVGVMLTSQLRCSNTVVATLIFTPINASAGTYQLTAPGNTLGWPVGLLLWDIRETVAGVTRLTNTYEILVERAVTRI